MDKKDPELSHLLHFSKEKDRDWMNGNIAQILTMDGVGCEKFAEYVYNFVAPKIIEETKNRVNLKSVEVFEHGSNSAIYYGG